MYFFLRNDVKETQGKRIDSIKDLLINLLRRHLKGRI